MMTKKDILVKINPILIELVGDSITIELSTRFDEISMDSIKFILLIVKTEEIFGFEIDDDNLLINKYITIDDYMEMLLYQIKN